MKQPEILKYYDVKKDINIRYLVYNLESNKRNVYLSDDEALQIAKYLCIANYEDKVKQVCLIVDKHTTYYYRNISNSFETYEFDKQGEYLKYLNKPENDCIII